MGVGWGGGESTRCASTAFFLKLRRANARRLLTHRGQDLKFKTPKPCALGSNKEVKVTET